MDLRFLSWLLWVRSVRSESLRFERSDFYGGSWIAVDDRGVIVNVLERV